MAFSDRASAFGFLLALYALLSNGPLDPHKSPTPLEWETVIVNNGVPSVLIDMCVKMPGVFPFYSTLHYITLTPHYLSLF